MSIQDTIESSAEGERCIVCDKSVAGGKGFAHIKHAEEMVTLCCPLCLETFQKNPSFYIAIRDTKSLLHPQKAKPNQ